MREVNSRRTHYNEATPKELVSRRKRKSLESIYYSTATLTNQIGRNSRTTYHRRMARFLPFNFLQPSLQSIQFSHFFIFILFLSSATFVHSKRCDIDKCGNHYRSISSDDDNTKRCRLLSLHGECLRKMKIACRGNLLYHTSVHISETQNEKWNCSSHSAETIKPENPTPSKTNHCVYAAGKPKYKFCGLFGDPHVRTFSDKFHTCKANGSWRLIHNNYLLVKATNSQLPGQMRATAVSKLVIVIRRSGECAHKKTYRAEIENPLPDSFVDGTKYTGPDETVNITVTEPGKEVQIVIRFIATTIVVRHVGSHLAFSIQMPEEIVNSAGRREQMCVTGCPRSQRIPLSLEIERLTDYLVIDPPEKDTAIKKYSESEARRMCRDALLNDGPDVHHREKRSSGKSKNRNRKRELDMDAPVETWKLLSNSNNPPDIRSPGRTRKNRNRSRNNKSRRKGLDMDFLHDDPNAGQRDRGKSVVSNVGRGRNFYFEACVFDLMTTGDIAYASSARGAYDDVTRFHHSGGNAKGASKSIIARWPIENTTTEPITTTSTTLRNAVSNVIQIKAETSTKGSARSISFNLPLLFFCVLYSTITLNFNKIFEFHNLFYNRRTIVT